VLALQVDQKIDHLAWIETSSAETGSSHTIRRGPSASARAMQMRWRWPPEKLMRIVPHLVRPKPDLLEQLGDPFLLGAAGRQAMHTDRLADDIARHHARIERGKRILEDDLHRAPMRPQVGLAEVGDVLSAEPDAALVGSTKRSTLRATVDLPRRTRRPAERLADTDREADAVDRMHGAAARRSTPLRTG